MLPRQLYELLPYIYIVTGITCAVLIDSTIVLISSILLIVTGVFVLLMRRNFRRSLDQQYAQYQADYGPDQAGYVEKRSGLERRRRNVASWPALDDAGRTIASDRRTTERRASAMRSQAG